MANAYAKSAENATLPCRRIVIRRQGASSLLVALGFLALVVGAPLAGALLGWVGVLLAFMGALASFMRAGRVVLKDDEGGTVTLRDGGVRVVLGSGETHRLALADIESGYEAADERAAVLVLANGRQIHLSLSGDTPARVLAHAGVATTQRVLTMPLRRMLGAFTIGFVTFWASIATWSLLVAFSHRLIGAGGVPLVLFLSTITTALVVLRFGFPRVVVGTDGIRVLGVLRPRFVPYEAIEAVTMVASTYEEQGARAIRVMQRAGGVLSLPTVAAPTERLEALVQRIDEASRLHAAGGARSLDALARAGRPAATWKEEIRRVALAPAGFRAQALDRDDFERVLDDAAAPPDHRIGAALALHAMDPDAAPARIRIAADASADDALREALALAAEGEIDDAALERAETRKAIR